MVVKPKLIHQLLMEIAERGKLIIVIYNYFKNKKTLLENLFLGYLSSCFG